MQMVGVLVLLMIDIGYMLRDRSERQFVKCYVSLSIVSKHTPSRSEESSIGLSKQKLPLSRGLSRTMPYFEV